MTTPNFDIEFTSNVFSVVLKPTGQPGDVPIAVGPKGRLAHMIPLDAGANQIAVSWPCASKFLVNYRVGLGSAQVTIANSDGATNSANPVTIIRQAGVEAGGGELWVYALDAKPGDANLRPTIQVINTGTKKL